MKNSYLLNNFKYISGTQKFKLVLLFLSINAFYGGFVISQPGVDKGYINTILKIYTNPYFMMILLITILFNTFHILDVFSKNNEYIIRLKNKSEYLKKLVQNIIFNNFVVYIAQLILILIIMNICYSGSSGLGTIYYGINNLLYFVFYIIRTFILIELLNIINLYIIEIFNSKYVVMMINIFIFVSIPSGLNLFIIKLKDIVIPTYIATYFRIYPYDGFLSELSSTIVFVLFLRFLIFMLNKLQNNNFFRSNL